MFTGLVEELGEVARLIPAAPGAKIVVNCTKCGDATVGDSVAINGCCLTVVEKLVEKDEKQLHFDAGEETLDRTNLARLAPGAKVNLERSLRVGDRLGGHFVTGHIDCVGRVMTRTDEGEWSTIWFSVPQQYLWQMASKGSVAIDGVSLTLVDVTDQAFSVMLIPHTLSVTTLGIRQVGDEVNVETDLLAKYVQRSFDRNPDV